MTIKTKYTIILLGENKNNYNNFEVKHSESIIIQIYDILINLKNNNDVIDFTNDLFIDNLIYTKFIRDIVLIQNAKYNINFGGGGSLCFSLAFAKQNSIIFNHDAISIGLNTYTLTKENTFFYNNLNDFLNKISNEIVSDFITFII